MESWNHCRKLVNKVHCYLAQFHLWHAAANTVASIDPISLQCHATDRSSLHLSPHSSTIAHYNLQNLQFEKQHIKSNFNKDSGKIAVEYFIGGKTNVAYNCLDRHIKEGRGDQPCFLWEGNELDQSRAMTYKQVLQEVSRLVSTQSNQSISQSINSIYSLG